jgi:glucosamine 6-phosphate synthetase-like amidotransferase/phosphosugar isomerase protein
MQTLLAAQSAPVSQCVIGSRYASLQGTITDQRAHPIHSESGKFSLFHNGFISNFKELCGANSDQTDSEVIASLIEECLLQGHTL